MPTVSDTAYPRLKANPTERELEAIYTPTTEEIQLAQQSTKGAAARVGFLILLKTFQRLGYPVLISEVPAAIGSASSLCGRKKDIELAIEISRA